VGLRKKKEIGFFIREREREMDRRVYGERMGGFSVDMI